MPNAEASHVGSHLDVLHVAAFHPPLDPRIFVKELRTLAEAGFSVGLLVRNPPESERDGVRFFALEGWAVGGLRGYCQAWRSVWKGVRGCGAGAVHFHEAELLPVMFLLRLTGLRILYDVHEDAPRQAVTRVERMGAARWVGLLVMAGFEAAEAIGKLLFHRFVCATPVIEARFPTSRRLLLCNYPALSEFPVPGDRRPPADRPMHVIYAGSMTADRGLEQMVQAVSMVSPRFEVSLRLAGNLRDDEATRRAKQMPGWARVAALGWLAREEVIQEISQSRVGLVVLHPRRSYKEALPVKLFEYMACGTPVVASDFPVWRRIVEEHRCGLVVDPLDPAAMAEAITWILEHEEEAAAMGERGRRAVEQAYNWEQQVPDFVAFYHRFLN